MSEAILDTDHPNAAAAADANANDDAPRCLPARMLNEFAYCPRLFHLEWVQREWRDNAETIDGARVHRRVDAPSKKQLQIVKKSGDDESDDPDYRTQHTRSVDLSSQELGLVARIDLVEAIGNVATPIDYKRSKRPEVPGGAYEPERVQLCAQGLLLREHGFRSERGILYFAGSRERVEIEFTDELVRRTLELRDAARVTADAPEPPPPLVDSPKCPRCSLVSICLPDEHNAVLGRATETVRQLIPQRDDALPLHVTEHGAVVGKNGEELVVRKKGEEIQRVRLIDVSRVNLYGAAQLTAPALREVLDREIPVALYSFGGWYAGRIEGHGHKNVLLRLAQFRAATDESRALQIARRLVCAKIRNSRVLLRRNHRALSTTILTELRCATHRARAARSAEELLGIEGSAARLHFQNFAGMLRRDLGEEFAFSGRNRRPPRDPVNALLSFVYALLAAEWTATISGIGFDPYLGFYHRPRYGRPALALDLMEEFRPIIADSVVLTVVNSGIVGADDFDRAATGVAMKPAARKRVVEAFERRMDEIVAHPVFGYRISYRRIFDVQARLLGRFLTGEIDNYPEFVTR